MGAQDGQRGAGKGCAISLGLSFPFRKMKSLLALASCDPLTGQRAARSLLVSTSETSVVCALRVRTRKHKALFLLPSLSRCFHFRLLLLEKLLPAGPALSHLPMCPPPAATPPAELTDVTTELFSRPRAFISWACRHQAPQTGWLRTAETASRSCSRLSSSLRPLPAHSVCGLQCPSY